MKIIRNDRVPGRIKGCVLTLGNFDGVHIGHQKILRRVSERAMKLGRPSAVYTFEPHPLKVIAPDKSPPLITDLKDRTDLIASLGMDLCVLARFTKAFASKHPRQFVEEVLVAGLGAKEVWVGHDYSFGRGKAGTVEYLKELGIKFGFAVRVIPAYKKGGAVVSSSKVRALIRAGECAAAAVMLGRPFSLKGKVVRGSNRGKELGFPTANLKTGNELVPAEGVYAVYASFSGCFYPAVANIGGAPTFGRRKTTVEVHMLDFTGSIYGKDIRVCFIKRLRDETRFKSAGELTRQIEKDVRRARRIL